MSTLSPPGPSPSLKMSRCIDDSPSDPEVGAKGLRVYGGSLDSTPHLITDDHRVSGQEATWNENWLSSLGTSAGRVPMGLGPPVGRVPIGLGPPVGRRLRTNRLPVFPNEKRVQVCRDFWAGLTSHGTTWPTSETTMIKWQVEEKQVKTRGVRITCVYR